MTRKKRNAANACYLLVYRDKDLKVVKHEYHFKDYASALQRRNAVRDSWAGEVIVCKGSSKEDILNDYPEYRLAYRYVAMSPEEEAELIKKMAESDFNKEVCRLLKEYDEHEPD